MSKPVNIYSAVIFDLNPVLKRYIDKLRDDGQIDLDDHGYPYLLKVRRDGPNHVCDIVRNGKMENFIINTRKKKRGPICSWDEDDGYVRTGGKKVISIDDASGEKPEPSKQNSKRAERPLRTLESFKRITTDILRS